MVSESAARYATDGILIAGGARAILLQVADPVVAAGVARHSDFAHRPVERLRNTLTFTYAAVLGNESDRALVAEFVNRAHIPVARADDAGLQLWVAATLYETATRVSERVHGPTDPALADELYAAYAALGTSLQMPATLWPVDRSAFAAYWTGRVDELQVTDDARRIAHDLFAPITAPGWLRAGLPLGRVLTLDLLPASVREAYGFEWTARDQLNADRAWALLRFVARVTPHRLRATPYRRLMRRLGSR